MHAEPASNSTQTNRKGIGSLAPTEALGPGSAESHGVPPDVGSWEVGKSWQFRLAELYPAPDIS